MAHENTTRFRFAPSPNGALHLGHAYSALLNEQLARNLHGDFLLRIEDIDTQRCTPTLEKAMIEDLAWLGLRFDGAPRRQSQHFSTYQDALETLMDAQLVYPAFLSRAESRARVEAAEAAGTPWPRDPDGAPHYPGDERSWSQQQRQERQRAQPRHAWRLDMSAALAHVAGRAAGGGVGHAASVQDQTWFEWSGDIDPNNGPLGAWTSGSAAAWGDVVLARSDTPTSYHLSVVLDDAIQGISHVVRGRDLEPATAVHRLLQTLLGLPEPIYHHHDLIVDDDGRKLSKSAKDTALSELRAAGLQPSDIRRMVGLG